MELLIRNFVLFFIGGWITYTDLKRHEIDHTPLIVGAIFAIPFTLFGFNDINILQSLLGCVILFLIFFGMTFFGMGGGDMKLMAMIGLFLGPGRGILTAVAAIYISAIFAIFIFIYKSIFKKEKKVMKSKMAMGPSIALGTIVGIYGYQYVLDWIASNIVVISG